MNRLFTSTLTLVVIALAMLLSIAGADAARSAAKPMILPPGAAVIVVAPAVATADDLESEAYGDWADRLDRFAASRPKAVALVRMVPARWRQLVRAPLPKDDYATVFLRRDGRVLVHDGMVLELEVYRKGAAWAAGRARVPDAAWGLVEGRLVRR